MEGMGLEIVRRKGEGKGKWEREKGNEGISPGKLALVKQS